MIMGYGIIMYIVTENHNRDDVREYDHTRGDHRSYRKSINPKYRSCDAQKNISIITY